MGQQPAAESHERLAGPGPLPGLAVPGELHGTLDAGQGRGETRRQLAPGGDPRHHLARELQPVVQHQVVHGAGSSPWVGSTSGGSTITSVR